MATGIAMGKSKLSFNVTPEARCVNNVAGDLFAVLMTALEVTVDVFSSDELVEFHTDWFDISNLFAATLAVYPPLGAKLILNEDEDHPVFKPAVLSCLHYTTQSSKAIVPALYMLAGMAMGTEESLETVYRFLDKAGGGGGGGGGGGDRQRQAWDKAGSGMSSSTMVGAGAGQGQGWS